MKKLLILLFILFMAPSYTDQLDADFNLGTVTDTNVTNNSVELNGSVGNYTLSGSFLSQVFDFGSNPSATIQWAYSSPSGTSILVNSRAGNTSTPDGSWTSYSGNYADNSGSVITNPIARYFQYRLQLATTNSSLTPAVQSVTMIYTEAGPTLAAGSNSDLQGTQTTSYRFNVTVTDTLTPTNISLAYRIGSDTLTTYQTMTLSGSVYYYDIPAPSGNWSNRDGETLEVRVYVENANNLSDNITVNEFIEVYNQAPILNNVANTTASEGTQKLIFFSGFDPDGDTVSFASSRGTVSSISATSAQVAWTPSNTEIGLQTINLSISDGNLTDWQEIIVNVSDVNDAPIMQAITKETGHYGDRIRFDVIVRDNDTNQNLTYTVEPPRFEINAYNNTNNTDNYTYYARGDFYAFDDFKGETAYTITVSDGQEEDSEIFNLSITYCGDGVCQTQENATACYTDCGIPPDQLQYLALELEERICQKNATTIKTFNASSRFICYREGKTHKFAAFCNEIDGVEIEIYKINKSQRTAVTTITSNADGVATFTPASSGEYKLIATLEDFIGTTSLITVHNCDKDISLTKKIVQGEKPEVSAQPREKNLDSRIEQPQLVAEETTLLSIILWYIIIPILTAGLIYVGSAYYELHKDTDPRLLAIRVKVFELEEKYYEVIAPYLEKAWERVGPIVTPPAKWVYMKVLTPVGHALKPLWEGIIRLIQR